MTLIKLQNVTRLYGIVIGVNDVNLELPKGAHGLLGPNGAGKTTLLNLITGQLSPTIGSVEVLGCKPRSSATLLRQIGYLPGSEGMYADVSALEWVTYLTRIQGFNKTAATQLAKQALDRVQLTEHMNRRISTYSRGMRQRTRLAQAIAHEPEFLILDEPFSGLDPIARHTMTTLLQQWIADGQSLLIASHVLHEIESLTRSFLLLNGGRLLASGSTEEISNLLTAIPSEVRMKVTWPANRYPLAPGEVPPAVHSLHFQPSDGNAPRLLAAELLQASLVDSIRVVEPNELIVTTDSVLELGKHLNQAVADHRYLISEVRGSDDSLQDVFHALMKMHRGVA
jgi:ABC-2 type transport system ATP-binding protein